MTGKEHVVSVQPMRKASDPDTFDLRCSCGWEAEAHGVGNARRVAQAHAERRSE